MFLRPVHLTAKPEQGLESPRMFDAGRSAGVESVNLKDITRPKQSVGPSLGSP